MNDAPVAYDVYVSTPKNTSVIITYDCFDVENDPLTYFAVSSPLFGVLSLPFGDSVVYTPNTGFVGSDEFDYLCNDGFLDSNVASVFVDVLENGSGNNPPVWLNISDAFLLEDFGVVTHVFDLNNFASDPDNDTLIFSISYEDLSEVDCEVVGDSLLLHSVQDWFGVASCTVRASDGFGGFADESFNVYVSPVNDAPVMQQIPDQTIQVGDDWQYQVICIDPDGDAISYADDTSLFDISNTGLMLFTPSVLNLGAYDITISCSDSQSTVSESFVLTIIDDLQEEPVVLTKLLIAYVGDQFTYYVQTQNFKGSVLTYVDDSPLFDIDLNSGLISFIPALNQVGTHYFTVTVTDGNQTASGLFKLKVLIHTQCSDGIDNDNDGLVDMNDLGCKNPSDDDEYNSRSKSFEDSDAIRIVKTRIYGVDFNTVERGTYATVSVTVENFEDVDVEDMVVGIRVLDFGFKDSFAHFDLDSGEKKTVTSYVYIPEDFDFGEYYFTVFVSNNDLSREKHFPVLVV